MQLEEPAQCEATSSHVLSNRTHSDHGCPTQGWTPRSWCRRCGRRTPRTQHTRAGVDVVRGVTGDMQELGIYEAFKARQRCSQQDSRSADGLCSLMSAAPESRSLT